MTDPVSAYLDAVRNELRFDQALAARVCAEVRDHVDDALREMSAGRPDPQAEVRAVQRFGDPREFAAAFAPVAIRRLERRTVMLLGAVLTAVFAMMELRTRILAATHRLPDWQHGATVAALTLDQTAFLLAVAATVTFAALLRRSAATRMSARLALPARVAIVSLAASVVADGVAFSDALHGSIVEAPAAITVLVLIAETGLVCALGWWIIRAGRSRAYFASL